MLEIKGKYNTAICYAKVIENEAIEQIRRMCDYDFTSGSKIRIMPDVHAGKGCTIGTTMTVTDKLVPNIVGVDIGCGMLTIPLQDREIDFACVDKAAHFVPSGMNVWEEEIYKFNLNGLRCLGHLKNVDWIKRSLGTLGGGNHFIEIDTAENGDKFLVIHSGSRNLGKQVAEHYQRVAVEAAKGPNDLAERKAELIRELKESGRQAEIQAALKELTEKYRNREPELPEDLCYLTGDALVDYLHDVKICQEFARQNREMIAGTILNYSGVKAKTGESFHTIHNYIDIQEMILRKGAIAAHDGETVLIPINMRDGSVLAIGKGNPEWNYSAPHGAGRIMSRNSARNFLDIEAYREAMKGIYTTSVNEETLDEAPMAYKSLEDIIDVIKEAVDVIEVLKPVYNFKASEKPSFAKK